MTKGRAGALATLAFAVGLLTGALGAIIAGPSLSPGDADAVAAMARHMAGQGWPSMMGGSMMGGSMMGGAAAPMTPAMMGSGWGMSLDEHARHHASPAPGASK